MLFVSKLLSNVDPTLVAREKLEDMVMSGVNRLLAMQTPSGGFGVWPGETEPVPWGTAYVTHTLIDARKQGYPVPPERIQAAVAYLESRLNHLESGGAGEVDSKYGLPPDQWEPYAHFVVALAGKGRKARAQQLVDRFVKNPSGERREQLYLLKAALHLAGDHRHEADLKRPDTSPVTDDRSFSWALYSDLRRRGFALNVFQDLFGSDPAGQPLADLVADALKRRTSAYFSTQELSFGVSGLGKRVGSSEASFPIPKLLANGRALNPNPVPAANRGSDRTWALARASEHRELAFEVPQGSPTLFALVSSVGIRSDARYRLGGEGLKVTRRYRKLEGSELDLKDGTHRLGDLVFVEATLTNTGNEKVTNIALVDRFPAGWEIENPRLGRGVQVSWVNPEKLWSLDYMNVRDDRLEVFGSLAPGETKKVVYTVRAVTSGSFTVPPIEAEAMYDSRVWAREDGRKVRVGGPWSDHLL